MNNRPNILFLCTGNSCRSQMAEGWARALHGERINAYSAGIESHGLNQNAVKVMAESGVDISNHKSETLDAYKNRSFDYVVTVCGSAKESCPVFHGECKPIHKSFPDPPKLAQEIAEQGGNEEAQLNAYRQVRDEIRDFLENITLILN